MSPLCAATRLILGSHTRVALMQTQQAMIGLVSPDLLRAAERAKTHTFLSSAESTVLESDVSLVRTTILHPLARSICAIFLVPVHGIS